MLAAAVWAAGSLYAKRADRPASVVLNIGAQMLCGGGLLGVAALLRGESLDFHPGAITVHSAWAFCYLLFVGALVGFSAYIWVLGAASPTLVGTYAFVNPGVAVAARLGVRGRSVQCHDPTGHGDHFVSGRVDRSLSDSHGGSFDSLHAFGAQGTAVNGSWCNQNHGLQCAAKYGSIQRRHQRLEVAGVPITIEEVV